MTLRTNILLGVAMVAVVGLSGYYWAVHRNASQFKDGSQADITIGGWAVHVDVVASEATREEGLSGRTGLDEGAGMLFVFDTDSAWGIWMKDMRFSIDIVWADANGTVVGVVDNAAPDSYPTVFRPSTPARYVIELPAGFAAAHGIAEGAHVSL